MERADEPLEDGTSINSALFSSIMNEIQLNSKYNVLELNPTINNYETPALSDSNRQGHIVRYDVNNTWTLGGGTGVDTDPYLMFSKDYNTNMIMRTNNTNIIYFETPKYTKMTKISGHVNSVNMYIYGSNDETTWTQIFSRSIAGDSTGFTFDITTNNFYKFYKLSFNPYGTGYGRVYADFTFRGYETEGLDINLQLGDTSDKTLHDEHYSGQLIKIKTPQVYVNADNLNVKLKIFNQSPKNITSTLSANTEYELEYDGTAFNVRS